MTHGADMAGNAGRVKYPQPREHFMRLDRDPQRYMLQNPMATWLCLRCGVIHVWCTSQREADRRNA